MSLSDLLLETEENLLLPTYCVTIFHIFSGSMKTCYTLQVDEALILYMRKKKIGISKGDFCSFNVLEFFLRNLLQVMKLYLMWNILFLAFQLKMLVHVLNRGENK